MRCALCPAATGDALAAGWTARTLAEPVTYRSAFGHGLPPTPPGEYRVCRTCSAWLADHRDRALPPAVVDGIAVVTADLHPTTARHLRMELIGMVRHLAEALTRETGGPAEQGKG